MLEVNEVVVSQTPENRMAWSAFQERKQTLTAGEMVMGPGTGCRVGGGWL